MMQVLEISHLQKSSVQETEADKGHESLYYPCQTEAWQFHVTKNRQHESKKKMAANTLTVISTERKNLHNNN